MSLKSEVRNYGQEDMEMPAELFTSKLQEILSSLERIVNEYKNEIERIAKLYGNLKEKQVPHRLMALNFSKHLYAFHRAIQGDKLENIRQGKLMEEVKAVPINNPSGFAEWPEGLEWGKYVENLNFRAQEIDAEVKQAEAMAHKLNDHERQEVLDGLLQNLINLNNDLGEIRNIIKGEEDET